MKRRDYLTWLAKSEGFVVIGDTVQPGCDPYDHRKWRDPLISAHVHVGRPRAGQLINKWCGWMDGRPSDYPSLFDGSGSSS